MSLVKKGRGAAGKISIFGLLKPDSNVYIRVVNNCSQEQLMPIIQGKALEGSTIHSDDWRVCVGLLLNNYVDHSANEFARGKSDVNAIESLRALQKTDLQRSTD